MRLLIYLISLSFLFSCDDPKEEKIKGEFRSLKDSIFNGRSYKIVLPEKYSPSKSYPVLFSFHGAYSNATNMQIGTDFDKYAPNFIRIYGQSYVENWEEGCKCNKPYRLGIDDIGYVKAIYNELISEFTIDQRNVFAVGFSQGGLFIHNLADKLPELFNAYAIVAAPMSTQLYDEIEPNEPISLIMIHGDGDNVLSYNGDNHPYFPLVSSPNSMKKWASAGDRDGSSEVTYMGRYNLHIYNKNTQYESKLFQIKNGGHVWPTSPINASVEILNFFNDKYIR